MKKIASIFSIVIIIAAFGLFFNAQPVAAAGDCSVSASDLAVSANEVEMLRLINEYRNQNGAGPIQLSGPLVQAASWMSRDLAKNGYMSHTDSLTRNPGSRINDCGFDNPYTWRGENIAGAYQSPLSALNAWKASPGHNALMLDPKWKAAGIGYVAQPGSVWGHYWVLDVASEFDSHGILTSTISNTPTPTPTPIPVPSPSPSPSMVPLVPAIVVNIPCINPGYSGNGITISWQNPATKVSWVDISTDSGFSAYYHQSASNLTIPTTTAPNGFAEKTSGVPLTLNPNTIYYVRLYNGLFSQVGNFKVPNCVALPAPSPSISVPVPSPSPVVLNSSNLLQNGDFEEGLMGWNVPTWWSNFVRIDSTLPESGRRSFDAGGKIGGVYLQQDVSTTAGKSLTLSGWVNIITANSGMNMVVEMQPLNRYNGNIGSIQQVVSYSAVTKGWVAFSKSYQMPANTSKVRVRVRFPSLNGRVFIDNLNLVSN